LDKLFDNQEEKSLEFVKDSGFYDNTNLVIFDKESNKTIYNSMQQMDKSLLNRLISIKDRVFFENDNYIAYSSSQNKKRFKIVVFVDKKVYLDKLNNLKNKLSINADESIKNSLIILGIIWFIMFGLSLFVSKLVYDKLKKYKNALYETNKKIVFQSRQAMLGELLPMIAHQWRQPINKIASVLMRMRFELAKDKPNINTLDRQCQTIESSIELMSNTIDDFRSFYRPKEKPEPINLAIIIRKAIFFLDELLEKKKIKIQTSLSNVESNIHANEFLQVIINLIKNAADAVNTNGTISITLKEINNNIVEVRVEDDGTGIPPDKIDKIFEAHFSSKEGSMGLGLYMSKLIIENHFNGIITAYNKQNGGAGFLIRFPKNL
jgi:signal transduction histidine kinase